MSKIQKRKARKNSHQLWGLLIPVFEIYAMAGLILVLLIGYGILPNRFYRTLYVYSGSMAPVIEAGDVIIITPLPAELTPGMVVTIKVDDYLVTHRLIDLKPDGSFTTKGDANIDADEWGNARVGLVGVYQARIPYLGYVFAALQHLVKLVPSGAWLMDRETLDLQFTCCVLKKTATSTITATPTATATPPPVWIQASTATPTNIPTNLPSEIPTGTVTMEATASPTDTFTETPTPTSTGTMTVPSVEPTETQLPEQPTETQLPEQPTETQLPEQPAETQLPEPTNPLPPDTPAP